MWQAPITPDTLCFEMVPHHSAQEDPTDVEEAAWSVTATDKNSNSIFKKKFTTLLSRNRKKQPLDSLAQLSALFLLRWFISMLQC